jgi:hypothetical protein
MVHNLTVIQPSDLMGNYFLQFIYPFITTQQVIHTQSTPFWVRSILKHKPEENLNWTEINTEIIHGGSLQWQKSSMKQYETGCQTCIIQDGTAPNLTIFIQNVFKIMHVIIKQKPLSLLYVLLLAKIRFLHSAKYGVWVHEPCVLMTIPSMLIKYTDMVYYKTKFMSEKSINL